MVVAGVDTGSPWNVNWEPAIWPSSSVTRPKREIECPEASSAWTLPELSTATERPSAENAVWQGLEGRSWGSSWFGCGLEAEADRALDQSRQRN